MRRSTSRDRAGTRARQEGGGIALWRRAVFSLLPALILLSSLELVAAALCRSRFADFHTGVRIQGDSAWAADPSLIWTNRPFYLHYDKSAQYNRYGMRVEPGQIDLPRKAAGELWVLCLGGSAMAGAGSARRGDWLRITGQSTHSIEHSIDGQLRSILQQSLPERKIRVFNAAVPAYSIAQSRLMYQKLRHLEMDWVISMDGFNEPVSLRREETIRDWLEAKWKKIPVNRFPLRQGRFLMRNSSFSFLFGERLLLGAGIIRNPAEARRDLEVFEHWLRKDGPPQDGLEIEPGPDRSRAVDRFLEALRDFDRELAADGQRHLLLVQPHLSLRDPSQAMPIERALLNYYAHRRDPGMDFFMQSLHRRIAADFASSRQIVSTDALHDSSRWIFLDDCHLALDANEIIAREISRHILSDGAYKPFRQGAPEPS